MVGWFFFLLFSFFHSFFSSSFLFDMQEYAGVPANTLVSPRTLKQTYIHNQLKKCNKAKLKRMKRTK